MVSNTRPLIAGLIGMVLLFVLSCAGGGLNPITPGSDQTGDVPGLTGANDPGGTSDGNQGQAAKSAGVWGIYDVIYDLGAGTFEIVPLRTSQFTFNMTGFLQPPDGNLSNLGITIIDSSELMQGRLILDVSITHPVPIDRFVGFDTYGVLVGNGTSVYNEDITVLFSGPDDLELLNADGYTRWMNPSEFSTPGYNGFLEGALGTKGIDWTATINGYKYFADGLSETANVGAYLQGGIAAAHRGAFYPDTTNTRRYNIQFPMPGGLPNIEFQYAIISHFRGAKNGGIPIEFPEIEDFPIDANAPEAIYVGADTSESTLLYNEPQEFAAGNLVLTLEVYDWQGMVSEGGTGVKNQIAAIGLGSPDGLFGVDGMRLEITDPKITENATPSENSTELVLDIDGLQPETWGAHEIVVAVYSADPTDYGPDFGSAWPFSAELAAYTRTSVDVIHDTEPGNHLPVIEEIQGETLVTCWDTDSLYTCIASDLDPDDTLQYQWEVTMADLLPLFPLSPTDDNTAVVDWSDQMLAPALYWVWFNVLDSSGGETSGYLEVVKSPDAVQVGLPTADPEDIIDVVCSNSDALYTAEAESCFGDTEFMFRWIRGTGTPPEILDPMDPDWTFPSEDNFVTYDWDNTAVEEWWIIAEAMSPLAGRGLSDPLIITRIDSPPTDINPPEGDTDVDCNNTAEIYTLTGGEDCDGGDNERQWSITPTNDPPTAGWVPAPAEEFTVNWSIYPMGTYFAWQRIGGGTSWTVSEALAITRGNTPPDAPFVPEGPHAVTCSDTDVEYDAGEITDCEADAVEREWALGTSPTPPESGWVSFTGTTFTVDFSGVESNLYGLWQRVSDDGLIWVNSIAGAMVMKENSPPDEPDVVTGPDAVSCYDTAAEYLAGVASDCDAGDVLVRSYLVTVDPDMPLGFWIEFSGDSFNIDWSEYQSLNWYIFQKTFDGEAETLNYTPLPVAKTNAVPVVGPPTGSTAVDCTSTEEEYTESEVSDCDPDTMLLKMYYVSTSETGQEGGFWMPYEGTSFLVDFGNMLTDEYYLFLSANDGDDETISDPLHITRSNTAPDQPAIPSGPAEVTCVDNPAIYEGGEVVDCDPFDTQTRYYYISTNAVTPTGGEWIETLGSTLLVEFDGVTAEQPYYLFQKVNDGFTEVVSESLEVIYHNTEPNQPFPPSGLTDVSCSNDNEEYDGLTVSDCDTWQNLTRSWAVNDFDWPPAVGWTEFPETTWIVDWSLYSEGTHYLFQRVYDGFAYSYSESLVVVLGPPTLSIPPIVMGNEDPICDGMVETYDAGVYMDGCPDVTIIRSYAISDFPTPPGSGWTVFPGTTFDIDPTTLSIGDHYVFQRAQLDAQEEISTALLVTVHPGALGTPDIPVGAATVDCDSIAENYEMGSVTTACPSTDLERAWQVQETDGDPVSAWFPFISSPVIVNWTVYPAGEIYHLVQRADDGDHVTVSDPLVVTFTNSDPEFLGTIDGPIAVTCDDIDAMYTAGEVEDCDQLQTVTREWSWNTVDSYPVSGWTELIGSVFMVDYSETEIQPGNVYLFQRASDGITTAYDPVSLHVVYTNSAPDEPIPPLGMKDIFCTNLQESYFVGDVSDCDGTAITRDWAISDAPTPPGSGWTEITGSDIDVDWSGYDMGIWYLYQRASDGVLTTYSTGQQVTKHDSPPDISEFTCDQGFGPFNSDGETSGLTGLDLVTSLDFTIAFDDCDGDTVTNYWAVTTVPVPPTEGDPDWNLIGGTNFTINLADFAASAPATLYVHLGSSDGTNWVTNLWVGSLAIWQKVWLTEFSSVVDMWAENGCVVGSGSYTWGYDAVDGYLRLEDYSAASVSAVWSDEFTMPVAPEIGYEGTVYTYMSPALAVGLDNGFFALMDDPTCNDDPLDLFTGGGCDSIDPSLWEFDVSRLSPMWDGNRMLGVYENGFDGCVSSEFYVDWAGVWVKPES